MNPFSIPAENIPQHMFGANLVMPAKICHELLHAHGKFPRILRQNGQNDLEGQGQLPLFSTSAENIPWCMFGEYLVILAWFCEIYRTDRVKFRERQAGRWMDGWTDAGNDNTPSAWKARVKKMIPHTLVSYGM